MKNRQGFISNSSSCSFIIMIKNKTYECETLIRTFGTDMPIGDILMDGNSESITKFVNTLLENPGKEIKCLNIDRDRYYQDEMMISSNKDFDVIFESRD